MTVSFANGFPCEPGWIRQALRALPDDSALFQGARIQEAMRLFAIGNKKVEALGRWIRGMGLAVGAPSAMVLTPVGWVVQLADPDLQAPGTWWYLHFMLAQAKGDLFLNHDLWAWFANEFFPLGFTDTSLREAAARRFPEQKDRTIQHGLNELRGTLLATPLAEYGLLRDAGGRWEKGEPDLTTLSPSVVLACIAYWLGCRGRDSAHFEELLDVEGGPGRVLGLARSRLLQLLEQASRRYGPAYVAVTTSAGLDTVWLGERRPEIWLAVHHTEHQGSSPQAALLAAKALVDTVEGGSAL